MRIGCNLMLWTGNFDSKSLKYIDRVAKIGYDGAELPLLDPKSVNVKTTVRALEGNGLGSTACSCIVAGSMLSADARERAKAVNHTKHVLETAKEIGCDLVCGAMYSPVGELIGRGPNATEWKRAVTCMKDVAKTAEDLGIDLALEPLNRFETFFLNTIGDASKFAKEVGSKRVGVHYDTFHMNIEEKDPVASLKKVPANRLMHIHASENDRGIPGTGHVPWADTFKVLKQKKYNGWVTVESFVPAIKELAKAACIWRPFAKDSDDLAKRGLAFLRKSL